MSAEAPWSSVEATGIHPNIGDEASRQDRLDWVASRVQDLACPTGIAQLILEFGRAHELFVQPRQDGRRWQLYGNFKRMYRELFIAAEDELFKASGFAMWCEWRESQEWLGSWEVRFWFPSKAAERHVFHARGAESEITAEINAAFNDAMAISTDDLKTEPTDWAYMPGLSSVE